MYNSRDSIIIKLKLIYYYKSREAMMYKYYSWKFTLWDLELFVNNFLIISSLVQVIQFYLLWKTNHLLL